MNSNTSAIPQPQHRYQEYKYPAGLQGLSYGANGAVRTTGVAITVGQGDVDLAPITSRGHRSKGCYVSVPRDRDTLVALANQLYDLAQTL